jgi:hypothetical protein
MDIETKLHKELDWLTIKHIDADGVIRNVLSICKQQIRSEKEKVFMDYMRANDFAGLLNTHFVRKDVCESQIKSACDKQKVEIGEKLKGEIDESLWNSLFNHE